MTTLYVLVGVPGSGKTTWIGHQSFDWDKTVIISTDKYVEQYAKSVGRTYTDVFQEYMPTAVEKMAQAAVEAFRDNKIVVWDQTSTSISTRAKKLRMAPAHYTKVAVVFKTPRKEIHDKFLDRPGKEIPSEVIQDMISKFVYPTLEEGFDRIINASLKGIDQ
jgi:predicted kinase